MIRMSLAQAASLLGATCTSSTTDVIFQGMSIDTRTLTQGSLFIAIPGTRVDGHDFIEQAKAHGASAALVTHPVETDLPLIMVEDVVDAIGKLASHWRNQFDIPMVAVTGSNGKTTLKNMIANIMIAACDGNNNEVLATQGTLNNHFGLPLTLARLNKNHRYGVIEMGMNHFGEIAYLSKLTQPTVAVINNAAAAHLEGVGNLEGVARAKAEIFQSLQPSGKAILNRDDPFYDYWAAQLGTHPRLSFGLQPTADVHAAVKETNEAQLLYLHTPNGNINVRLPLLGKHNAMNAIAATATALAAGISLEAIKIGLDNVQPAQGRLQIHSLPNGAQIIDDTYNANPFSLNAAVDTLATFEGKTILVLGDMKELGNNAKALHEAAGQYVQEAGINLLFTYGELSENASHAFGEGGYHFTNQEKLINALRPFLHNRSTILVKGSRSMAMEKVVKALLETSNESNEETV